MSNKQLELILNSILAVILIVNLFRWQYEVYVFNRVLLAIGFGILAYKANKIFGENSSVTLTYLCLGLLFQPLLKIELGRTGWIMVDIMVIIGLLYNMFKIKNKTN